jgi:hypothetical protein
MRRASTLFLPLLPALILAGCGDPECRNEIREEVVSPDGTTKVVIFSRDCGATTGFNCQGSILPAGDPLPNDDGGNAFIFDTGGAKATWTDSTTLAVSVEGSARAFKREVAVRGIKLDYAREKGLPGDR